MSTTADVIQRWTTLSAGQRLNLFDLQQTVQDVQPVVSDFIRLGKTDSTRPYGRQVLLNKAGLEVMIATWTRNLPCAPHTHGGSVGVVHVLQGASLHRVWKVTPKGLKLLDESIATAGDVLSCGTNLVHSMGDAGHADALVTLHLYANAIDHMLVYDTAQHHTLLVEGTCGAWIPEPKSGFIRAQIEGYHAHLEDN
jgi:cysteine dioxygenase